VRLVAVLLILGLSFCARAAQEIDSCQAQIPNSLSNAVETSFPGYRTPLETDNSPEDVEYNRSHGGTGCLGVAIADLNGEHKNDFLLGLSAKKDGSGLAVIAIPTSMGWSFHKIRSWSEKERALQYVKAVKPGKYDRAEALDSHLGKDERDSMQCPHWGALVGARDSTGIVYCHIDGSWSYVWVSD
jgi:hypothetical protein